MNVSLHPRRSFCRLFALFAVVFSLLGLRVIARADESAKRTFDIPSADASVTLKAFSEQSGAQIIFPGATVKGVTTNSVKGDYTAAEAIGRMLADTELYAVRDDSSGSFAVNRRAPEKNAEGPSRIVPVAGPKPVAGADQTIRLSPFQVQADSDTSYGALNSNSLTSFNVALDHLPISADIYDQAFMNDVGATSVEDMIQTYSAGAGSSALGPGSPLSVNQPDNGNNALMQFRGMMTPNTQRDSLLTLGSFGQPGGTAIGQTSNFDVERVELINGPQALLYDGGGGGGVINVVSKEARLGSPTFGSVSYRIDQFGTKYGQFDFGASVGNFAVRVAILDATQDTSRVNIGSHTNGQYVQFADSLGNTIFRVTLEQTDNTRRYRSYPTITSTAADPLFKFNGDSLSYLLATNQSSVIDNGYINWGNANSLYGNLTDTTTTAEFGELSADTRWTSWLSTQLSVGGSQFFNFQIKDQGMAFYTPSATSNPLPGNWTVGKATATIGLMPYYGKSARFSILMTNELFGGRAESKSTIGLDTIGSRGGLHLYGYYQADSNFNILYSPGLTSTGGRTMLGAQSWTINNGPLNYPIFRVGPSHITLNGVNYAWAIQDPQSKAAVTQQNPIGDTIIGGGNGENTDLVNTGAYAVNYTQWMGGKLDTLIGVRLEHSYEYSIAPEGKIPSPFPFDAIESHNFNFDVGADYHVLPWLAPYASVAMSYLLPPSIAYDPVGNPVPISQALSEEVGFKINVSSSVSGSLAIYHSSTKNEEMQFTNTLVQDINPTGLNGLYNSLSNTSTPVDVTSKGVQLTLTATPTQHWRIRLGAAYADGTIGTTKVFKQLYNDQFYENSASQVTFADGTVVYVPATFNSKQLTVASSAAGAQPLTTTLLSTPGSAYFTSPIAGSGQISASSPGASVLNVVDPVHGAILTGATGLPISNYQLNTALTGVSLPGSIPLAISGDSTTGYPEFSANITNVYTFASGWLKGVEIGGTASATTKVRQFYYYPNGIVAGGPQGARTLFSLPPFGRLDLILGYTRKVGRLSFSTQLNVYNLLNHYDVIVQPTPALGYTSVSALTGIFYQQPRSFAWTNRIGF